MTKEVSEPRQLGWNVSARELTDKLRAKIADPKTSEFKEWPSPSGPRSHPYAIAVVDGIVWYNESGQRPDALVRFDPRTETFQSWPIPSGGVHAGIVRHMRATRDGNLVLHQSSTNRIILMTPARKVAAKDHKGG